MPPLTDFLTKFGWPEIIITLAITLTIVSSHELRNVIRLFTHETKEKKQSTHTEE